MPTGIIKTYLDDRGFGFIRPDTGSADLFFHIKDCQPPGMTPDAHDAVYYDLGEDKRSGRLQAQNVRLV
jgi:CspA family cold shock protein